MTMDVQIHQLFLSGLSEMGLELEAGHWLYKGIAILLVLIIAYVSFKLTRVILRSHAKKLVARSRNNWDDELQQNRFFRRCGHIVPALALYILTPILLPESDLLVPLISKLAIIYIIATSVRAGSALLNTIQAVYNSSALAARAPITGFVQVGKLVFVVVGILLTISIILDKSPLLLMSGLGAVTAILLLVFKDAILGFVAGIQIAANRMVNTGDWIEMPKFGADGDVLEVGLTTVKVQNWDKTISTIPTYSLITESVKNWRGMQESPGRRIKRPVYLDINSIRFCDADMLEEFKKIRFISSYIDKKKAELAEYHQKEKIDEQDLLNSRRLTNIGTLRAYITAYLRHHPKVNQDLTLMVRQLPATELGVPLEIYCFSSDKNWVNYEGIQADIFDHILAMLPVFKLRAYQRVSDRQPEMPG